MAGCAYVQRTCGARPAAWQGNAQVQHAQHVVFTLVQIGVPNLAMNHVLFVQPAKRFGATAEESRCCASRTVNKKALAVK